MQGLVNYAQYGINNPYNNVLTDEELDNIKAQDLVDILHSLVNYKHTILYYGPQTAVQTGTTLAKLHKTPASFLPYPAAKKFTRVKLGENQVLFANYDMVQAEINWIRNEEPYDVAKTPAVELLNNYFGSGISSIIFQNIRESKALAYSTYAYYSQAAKKGESDSFVAYVGTQADKMNEAIKAMNELLNSMPESEKGLLAARDNVRKSIETERVTQDDILFNYLDAKLRGLDYDLRKNTFTAINKLGLADVKAFHDAELKDKPYTYCIVASEKRVSDEDLKKYGVLSKPDLKTIFGY